MRKTTDSALPKIGELKTTCPACGWVGTVYECEPDVDGDGSLGCAKCNTAVITELETTVFDMGEMKEKVIIQRATLKIDK